VNDEEDTLLEEDINPDLSIAVGGSEDEDDALKHMDGNNDVSGSKRKETPVKKALWT
jgi:hypothetical protein